MAGTKPDPAVPPAPRKVPLIVRVVDGFGQPLSGAEVEVVNLNGDVKKNTGDKAPNKGLANFGLVDPRRKFDIKVRKSKFGPPGNPFTPGENRVVRRPDLKKPIELPLTLNLAMLRIEVLTPLPDEKPIEDAIIGIDGITGVPPDPKTDKDGQTKFFLVPPGNFRFHAKKHGFGPEPVGSAKFQFDGEVVGFRTLVDGSVVTATLHLLEAPFVAPAINPNTAQILVVKKPHTNPKRREITVSTDVEFDGKGVLSVSGKGSGSIKIFNQAVGGVEVSEIPAAGANPLNKGVKVFLEGQTASSDLEDLTLTFSLKEGTKNPRPPVTLKITVVELTLDICKSRTSATTDPDPLSDTDKINVGRFVHNQFGTKHGRAMLIVRQPKPQKFTGALTLKAVPGAGATAPRLFAATDEIPAAGQAALALPLDIPSVDKAGKKFFVEGAGPSAALRDIELQLGVKGVEDDGDHVKVTTVEFSKLKASMPTTPENQTRLGNATTPARNDITVGAAALSASDFEENFFPAGINNTIVLLENSIRAADPIQLSVQVKPNNVPVLWRARRDTRPSPLGDDPRIATLTPAPKDRPTISAGANPLQVTMVADSVGSFHVAAYVDCNGNSEWDFNDPTGGARIDREPFIPMCFIFARVQGFQNNSRVPPHPTTVSPSPPTSATGVGFSSGSFTAGPAAAGVHNDAIVTLIGGGRDGRLGLDRVYGGWVNNVTAIDSVAQYVQAAAPPNPAVTHNVPAMFASNAVAITLPAGPIVTRFVTPAAAPSPLPANMLTVPPAVIASPLLDCTNFGNEGTGGNTCVGTEGAVGPPLPTPPTPLPTATHNFPVGEDRRIQMFDSPGFGASASHPVFPGQLTSFKFNVDFRCDLCFWTNIATPPSPGATNDPSCRLYVTVQTDTWRIRFDVTFNLAAGGAATIGNQKVEITVDSTPTRQARAIDRGSDPVEVRFPIALRAWSLDART